MKYTVKFQEAIGILEQAKQIYGSIIDYQDSAFKIRECDERIAEIKKTIDDCAAELREKEAKRKREEFNKKMRIVGGILLGLGLISIWVYLRFLR